jgi:hypothetical protein
LGNFVSFKQLVYDLLDDFLTSKYAIIAATAKLAAIGAANSATYHTTRSGIVTFINVIYM